MLWKDRGWRSHGTDLILGSESSPHSAFWTTLKHYLVVIHWRTCRNWLCFRLHRGQGMLYYLEDGFQLLGNDTRFPSDLKQLDIDLLPIWNIPFVQVCSPVSNLKVTSAWRAPGQTHLAWIGLSDPWLFKVKVSWPHISKLSDSIWLHGGIIPKAIKMLLFQDWAEQTE